jgi:hypothetical protein
MKIGSTFSIRKMIDLKILVKLVFFKNNLELLPADNTHSKL